MNEIGLTSLKLKKKKIGIWQTKLKLQALKWHKTHMLGTVHVFSLFFVSFPKFSPFFEGEGGIITTNNRQNVYF